MILWSTRVSRVGKSVALSRGFMVVAGRHHFLGAQARRLFFSGALAANRSGHDLRMFLNEH
jgi:hypothetical protein